MTDLGDLAQWEAHPFRKMQQAAHQNSRNHGFWDGQKITNPLVIPTKLALIHSEVSEALEDNRNGIHTTRIEIVNERNTGKPIGFPTELADVVIRCMDLAEAMGIDLWAEIERKHAYNITRPLKHGGKTV